MQFSLCMYIICALLVHNMCLGYACYLNYVVKDQGPELQCLLKVKEDLHIDI